MYTSSLLSVSALLALANAHGVILGAQGLSGSPPSVGFKVHDALPRNCTSISPCQQDSTIIRDAEINANIVNECGRTQLDGNIDIGENTENALAAGAVTQVKKGSTVDVTIHQINADGAGPYTCDVIAQGNNGVITFPNVKVADNVPGANGFSQAKEEQFVIKVTMPDALNCTGSSAGNVCTVRCRNNALAGPFGGCFPVQQVDIQPTKLKPSDVDTLLSLDKTEAQVAQNIKDLPAAIAANQAAGTEDGLKNAAILNKLLQVSAAPSGAPKATSVAGSPSSTSAAPAATETARAGNGSGRNRGGNGNGNGRGNGNGNGNANGNNGNGNGNANGNGNGNGNANGNNGNANGNGRGNNNNNNGNGNAGGNTGNANGNGRGNGNNDGNSNAGTGNGNGRGNNNANGNFGGNFGNNNKRSAKVFVA